MFAYVLSGIEAGEAGGMVLALSYSARTVRPDHAPLKYSPASGGANVPLVKVLPWQTAQLLLNEVLPAAACAAVNCGGIPAGAPLRITLGCAAPLLWSVALPCCGRLPVEGPGEGTGAAPSRKYVKATIAPGF